MASMHISRDPEPEELELHEMVTTQLTDTLAWVISYKTPTKGDKSQVEVENCAFATVSCMAR